jgi:hypothetical protein
MTDEILTTILAQRVMGWTVGPDRFLLGDRRWMPRWRFQPTTRVIDAFRLLDRLAAPEYWVVELSRGGFRARVRVRDVGGEAINSSKARALTLAIARAIGIEVDACE